LLAGPVLIAASWAATLAQPDEFSLIQHATSDLGADTAEAAWVSNQLSSNLPGLLVLVFAIGLCHWLGRHHSARIGAFLVGVVGAGLFLTGFLTLDCREIDSGCSGDDVSWQANGHMMVAILTVLALLVAPFVVARAMKFAAAWRDLRVPTVMFGVVTIVGGVAGSVVGAGLGQYVLVAVWFAWVTVLALRMFRLSRAASQRTPSAPIC
jgi:hypothetical protein